MTSNDIDWAELEWLNPPLRADLQGNVLEVEARPRSDFWRRTQDGGVRDDAHFLSRRFVGNGWVEVTFSGTFPSLYDQAGLMLRAREDEWIKAGVERVGGELLASAVVTHGQSDWSVAPLPVGFDGSRVTVRASRSGNAVTIRHRFGDQATWRTLRMAYFAPEVELSVGVMCCSPTGSGLVVRFDRLRIGPLEED
jgi:regulation of enolase protein 1 (concanavalin A-like superfamily)